MSQISDLILKQVQAAASGSNLSSSVLNGLSESVLSSFKKTASTANGIEQLTSLLTGKSSAESSPITALASQIFTSQIASKLGLSSSASSAASSLLPAIIGGLVSSISSKGLDLSSILSAVGGSNSASTLGKLASVAGKLGGLFKKK